MKKFILVLAISLALTLVLASITMATNKVMFSYDMEGKYESSDGDWWEDGDTKVYDTESGFAVGYECTIGTGRIEYGFGFETQLYRSLADYEDDEFKFSPMYGVIYVHFAEEGESRPFFVGRLGYNMHSGNDSYKYDKDFSLDTELGNGMYYAVGFGFDSERHIASIMYSINSGRRTSNADSDYDRDVYYSKFSFVFGYKF